MKELTNFQKVMLINAVPAKFILNAVGGILAVYYLWQHDLAGAAILGLPPIILGTLISKFYLPFDPKKIAITFLGKIFLCYSQGVGLILYLLSHILIPLSFWLQNIWGIFAGLIILLIGLILSWKQYFH